MQDSTRDPSCPKCGSADVPRLIVRGGGPSGVTMTEAGVKLQCRSCRNEWSELSSDRHGVS